MKSDPSMEQILASIRKIMAEEAAGQPVQATALSPDENHSENILELTQIVEENVSETEGSDTAINPVSSQNELVENPSGAEPLKNDTIISRTSDSMETTQAISEAAPPNSLSDKDQVQSLTEEVTSAFLENNNLNAEKTGLSGGTNTVGKSSTSLLSENVVHAGVNAIQELIQISEKQREPEKMKDPLKGKTIDDIMENLLRPLLSDWLNQNLPNLVEKVVKEEIRKLMDRI